MTTDKGEADRALLTTQARLKEVEGELATVRESEADLISKLHDSTG